MNPCIVIPKGFIFDGVSVPKFIHWFLSPTGVLFIPGLIHDFSYRYGYLWALDDKGKVYRYMEGSNRHYWDSIFRRLGLELNGMVILNAFARVVLLICGWKYWKKNREQVVCELKPLGK